MTCIILQLVMWYLRFAIPTIYYNSVEIKLENWESEIKYIKKASPEPTN